MRAADIKRGVPAGVEAALGLVVVLAIGGVISFFLARGYLPPPFFRDASDTFMDWYNTAYWAHNFGAYQEWGSVYPPLSFDFLKLFTNPLCYRSADSGSRQCDPAGFWVLLAFAVINFVLVLRIYARDDPRTAWPRAIAIGFGMPMLFAWERGNLILPCFTCFILGHGRLLRSAWLKWTAVALAVNFKPYLILSVGGLLIKRRWRWLEGCGVACVVVYGASFVLFGQGSPGEILGDILGYAQPQETVSFDAIAYTTSFRPLLDLLGSRLPLTYFLGSHLIESLEHWLPLSIRIGEAAVLACFAGAVLRPTVLTSHRLAALTMCLFLTAANPGGYAGDFLLFFVFLERWRHPGVIVAILCAYLLCIPWDLPLTSIAHESISSYLSGRTAERDISLMLGEFVRPALYLIIEYGLAAACLWELFRAPAAALTAGRTGTGPSTHWSRHRPGRRWRTRPGPGRPAAG